MGLLPSQPNSLPYVTVVPGPTCVHAVWRHFLQHIFFSAWITNIGFMVYVIHQLFIELVNVTILEIRYKDKRVTMIIV